jgi:Ca2+-binding RTX toxin-like protein
MQVRSGRAAVSVGANFNTNIGDSVLHFQPDDRRDVHQRRRPGRAVGQQDIPHRLGRRRQRHDRRQQLCQCVTVDLRPGEFSTVDQAQLANNLAYQNLVNLAPGNIAMSLLTIRRPVADRERQGGAGNDVFVGNTANNLLDGGPAAIR